jgi:hypothetical protein
MLRRNDPMMLAAGDSSGGHVAIRMTVHPDGASSLFRFTGAPEVVGFNSADAVVSLPTGQVLNMGRGEAIDQPRRVFDPNLGFAEIFG